MGFFDLFKKKKVALTEEQLKWNRMWELWTNGEADPPYAELMTYQSEINNGGHCQYFSNLENAGELSKELFVLDKILSPVLKTNLQKAYEAFMQMEDNDEDEEAEEILEQCDNAFYENEQEINCILNEYANKIQL